MKDKVQASAMIVLGHLDEEIKVRQEELKQLTGMQAGLRELYGLTSPAEPVQTPERPKAKAAKKIKTGGASAPVAPGAGAGSGRAPSAETVKLMAVIRTAPEPFTMDSLRVASGIDNTKTITNALMRGVAKGWLARAGRGEYKRTATFPNTAE